jgi:hypothetical protein
MRLEMQTEERSTDAVDVACSVERLHTEAALRNTLARGQGPKPRADGLCACGCGDDVEPKRLELGLGLAIECARRRERYLSGR